MMIIGLTGGIGSGKSTVAAILKKCGIAVIDADELAHTLTQKGSQALTDIVAEFGPGILTEQKELNRRKLAHMVFSDQALLTKLEAILHPKIEAARQRLLEELLSKGHQVVVYMAPLLFEKNLHKNLSKTLVIISNRDLVNERIKLRDNLSTDEIEKRLQAQMSNQERTRMADEVLENNGTLDELLLKLKEAWIRLTGRPLPPPQA